MDLKLIQYVEALNESTQFEASSPPSPKYVRRTNAVLGKTTLIVVSHQEPYSTPLPLNVVWACFTKSSPMYRKIYRRVSKDPNPSMGTQHTWELLMAFDELWEDQYYAEGDEPDSSGDVPIATTDIRGIVKLSGPADEGQEETPVVVTDTDPRNFDPRYPLIHDEMHDEKPLRRVKTTGDNVLMDAGSEGNAFIPIAQSETDSSYMVLEFGEVYQQPTLPASPASVSNLPYPPFAGQLRIPELTVGERLNGCAIGKNLTIAIIAFGANEPSSGFKRYIGYYVPTEVRVSHNGGPSQVLPNNTLTIAATGVYQISADLTDAASGNTVTVGGAVVGI